MTVNSSVIKKLSMWIALVIALGCSFILFWYTDIGDTLDNGVLLAESVVNGEFFDYYEYAAVNSSPYTGYSANYNILLYAIFAIWNLPTVVLHIFCDFDYMSSRLACAWCKLIIILALVGIFFVVKKIAKKLGGSDEDCKIAGFLSVSSLCVMVPALIASQYDCISLLFMLLGIMFFADGKDKLFLLMFAIAVPLKLFAVFIFIPIILLRHKNVLKLLGMIVLVIFPSYVIDLPFSGNMYYKAAMDSQNGDALELLLKSNISVGDLKINLFFAAYIIICFVCYLKHEDDRIRESHLAVYFSFAVFAAFCALIPIRSYWIILFTPFLAILAAMKKGNKTVALLADTFAGLGGGLYFLAHHWIYNTGHIAGGLALRYHVLPEGTEQKYGSFSALLDSMGLSDVKYVFFAVFLGAVVFALYYLYPSKKDVPVESDGTKEGEYWTLLSRPVILLFVTAVMLYCHLATVPTVKYGQTEYTDTMDSNLMTGEAVTDDIIFDEDQTLTTMTLHLDTWAYRAARAFVGVRMYDTVTSDVIFDDSVAIVLIDNDRADFELNGLKVEKDKPYKIELYAITPELAEAGTVYPYVDSEGRLAVTFR